MLHNRVFLTARQTPVFTATVDAPVKNTASAAFYSNAGFRRILRTTASDGMRRMLWAKSTESGRIEKIREQVQKGSEGRWDVEIMHEQQPELRPDVENAKRVEVLLW